MNKKKSKTTIKNNMFQGVVWDGEAVEAVNNIAKALLNLTEVLNSQHVNITMLKVNSDLPEGKENPDSSKPKN